MTQQLTSLTTIPDEGREPGPLDSLKAWGELAMKGGLLPQGMTIYQAMLIIQTGREIGIAPLQSLRCMNFIKGRMVMSVQLQLALARCKGVTIRELAEGDGVCRTTLARGSESITCTYTMQDAKKAGLVRVDGSYDKYARQMLRWRALGDALRLLAPDVVMGLLSPEEAGSLEPFLIGDIPEPITMPKAIETTPKDEPVAQDSKADEKPPSSDTSPAHPDATIIPATWIKGKDSKGKSIPHPHAGRPIQELKDGDLISIMEGLRADSTIPGKPKEAKYQALLDALENELERRVEQAPQTTEN